MLRVVSLAIAVALMSPQPPRFRAGVDLVEVDAVVLDERGDPVAGLTADDFEIREDGAPRPIAAFVSVNADEATQPKDGRFVVLVLDNLLTDPVRTTNIKKIGSLFARQKSPNDVMAVVNLSDGAATTTTNTEQLLADIERFKPIGRSIFPDLENRALDVIRDLGGQLAGVQHRRKTLVVVGSGSTFRATGDRNVVFAPEWTDALSAASRANVSIYLIDPNGLTGGRYDGALSFTSATGGEAFVNSNLFDQSVERILAEAGHYYLLGYEPAKRDRRTHRIAVSVKRSGLSVRARRVRG